MASNLFSDLATLVGAPADATYPWIANPTLTHGARTIVNQYGGNGPIAGTVARLYFLATDGIAVANWESNPITEAHRLLDLDVLKRIQALLKLFDWLHSGIYQNATYFMKDTTQAPRQQVGPFDIVSASGTTLTLDSGATDIRDFSGTAWSGTVSPFDEVFFENSVAGEQILGLVTALDLTGYTGAGDNFSVELLQECDIATTAYPTGNTPRVYFRYAYEPEPWLYLADFHGLYTYRERKTWTKTEADALSDRLPLKRYSQDSSTGKISKPSADSGIYCGTVKVWLIDSDGDPSDVTATYLSRFSREHNSSSPFGAESFFDSSSIMSAGESLEIEYSIERDGNTDIRTTTCSGQDRCKFALLSADGSRSFCGKGRASPSKLARFTADCYQDDCDGFAEHEPFSNKNLGTFFDQALLSSPLLLEQILLPPTEDWQIVRVGVPGLASMLGFDREPRQITGILKKTYLNRLYGTGAFWPLASTYLVDADSFTTSEVEGLLSDSGGEDAFNNSWTNTTDPDYGARSLLASDRVGTANVGATSEALGGRSLERRTRLKTWKGAALNCEHSDGDPVATTTGEQVHFGHNDATDPIVLTVQALTNKTSEVTISTGTVDSISDLGSDVIAIEPANKTVTIQYYDTGPVPPIVATQTVEVGAPGPSAFVSCHSLFKLRDATLTPRIGGSIFDGCIAGDWIRFTGLSGFDDAAAIMNTGFLVTRVEPFGGSRQDPNTNGSPGNPDAQWLRPTNFGDGSTGWGFKRSRILLEDHNDLLADNVANLAGAAMKATHGGGVLREVTALDNNGDAISVASCTVDPYKGTISIPWGTANSGSAGYYTVSATVVDCRSIAQGAAFEELKDGIELLEGIGLVESMSGSSFDPYADAYSRYQDFFGDPIEGFSGFQSLIDFQNSSSSPGPAPFYREYSFTGAGYSSGGGSYALCPTGSQEPTVVNMDAGNIFLDTGNDGGISGGYAHSTSGALATDYLLADRQYRRGNFKKTTATVFTPSGILTRIPSGATITESTIDVKFTNIEYAEWDQRKHGYRASPPPGETVDAVTNAEYYQWPSTMDTLSSAPNITLELYAKNEANQLVLLAGDLTDSFEENTTETLDITNIVQDYIDTHRGQTDFVELVWIPQVHEEFGAWSSYYIPDRTGEKSPEYASCSGGTPIPTSSTILADNDYTDRAIVFNYSAMVVSNWVVKFELPEEVRDLRIPYNPATVKYREITNA